MVSEAPFRPRRIYGVGTDLVSVARMQRLLDRHGVALAARVLTAAERPALATDPHPARFLAKRFAAKEAFAKALGTGLRAPVTLGNLAVTHGPLGRPDFGFHPELTARLRQLGVVGWQLSLSDERDYALAFVILEQEMV